MQNFVYSTPYLPDFYFKTIKVIFGSSLDGPSIRNVVGFYKRVKEFFHKVIIYNGVIRCFCHSFLFYSLQLKSLMMNTINVNANDNLENE